MLIPKFAMLPATCPKSKHTPTQLEPVYGCNSFPSLVKDNTGCRCQKDQQEPPLKAPFSSFNQRPQTALALKSAHLSTYLVKYRCLANSLLSDPPVTVPLSITCKIHLGRSLRKFYAMYVTRREKLPEESFTTHRLQETDHWRERRRNRTPRKRGSFLSLSLSYSLHKQSSRHGPPRTSCGIDWDSGHKCVLFWHVL